MSNPNTHTSRDAKPVYRPTDIKLDYERDLGDPGEYPYTRGTRPPKATVGTADQPIVRELSGEGSAARSNEQFRYLLEHGATGLDVIGDAPTVGFMDPDHPYARHAVGNQGVSLCRADDYRRLYEDIPLGSVSVSHSCPAGFTVAGLYLAAQAHGISPEIVRGSAILGPLFVEDTGYSSRLPLELHMRLATDSIQFCAERMARFNPFVEDTYYISDGSVDIVDEMALGFIEIREVVRRLVARGVPIDAFAPRIVLLVNFRMELFREIAKIRASRRLYARMMYEEFGARDPRSLAINVAAHTSGATMTSQQLLNNVVRGAIQTTALYLAGVRAVEISAFDEPVRTPSKEAHIVGLRTQQVVALETGLCDVADPLGGSYYVESLTNELEHEIRERIAFIESLGDIADLSSQGYFRSLFTEAMVARATEVRSATRAVVGVNVFEMRPDEDRMLRDLAETRIEPAYDVIDEIRTWKATRDVDSVVAALADLEAVASRREINCMPSIVAALEANATMGECAGVMRVAYGAPYDPFSRLERPHT